MNDEEFDRTNIAVLETFIKESEICGLPPWANVLIRQILNDHERIEKLEERVKELEK